MEAVKLLEAISYTGGIDFGIVEVPVIPVNVFGEWLEHYFGAKEIEGLIVRGKSYVYIYDQAKTDENPLRIPYDVLLENESKCKIFLYEIG